MSLPQLIIVLTGTRACAKEFMAKVLHCVVGEGRCYTVNLMDAIEHMWSIEDIENNPVMLQQAGAIITDSDKQRYRRAMIEWSNDVRTQDPGCFCRIACEISPLRERWFICGIKRTSEIDWFKRTFGSKVKTVRITTIENQSKERIWQLCCGDVDDDVPEFDLDDYNYDVRLHQSSLEELSESLQTMAYFMDRFIIN